MIKYEIRSTEYFQLHIFSPKMKPLHLVITICTLVIYTPLEVHAEQSYIGDPKKACNAADTKAIYFGYSCNEKITCDTKLTYRSQDPYNTLSSIGLLLGVDPQTIKQANPNISSSDDAVELGKLIYIPVTCSCPETDIFYNKVPKTTYSLASNDTFYRLAHGKYQGLTTCVAIRSGNRDKDFPVTAGTRINIPLRCACPTVSQKSSGIKSLFTYVIGNEDTISSISTQLKVDNKSILQANNLEEDSIIYPNTTLLIPVMKIDSTSGAESKSALSTGAIGGIVAAACAALLAIGGGVAIKLNLCGSLCTCFNRINHITNINQGKADDETKPSKPKASPDGPIDKA